MSNSIHQPGLNVTCNKTEHPGMVSAAGRRVQKHRGAVREAGLQPLQIWIPDTQRPGFAKEGRWQARLVAASDAADADLAAFLDHTLTDIAGDDA
jgi:Protein  of unknown function (DUF3018)